MHCRKREFNQLGSSNQAPPAKKSKVVAATPTQVMVERPATGAIVAPTIPSSTMVITKQIGATTINASLVSVVEPGDKATVEATSTLPTIQSKCIHNWTQAQKKLAKTGKATTT